MRGRAVVVVLVAASLLAACGSRVDPDVLAARDRIDATGSGAGGDAALATDGEVASDGSSAPAVDGAGAVTTVPGSVDGGTASGPSATVAGRSQTAVTAAPKGGNGGATDKGVTADT